MALAVLAAALAFVQGDAIVSNGHVVAHGSWASWSPSGKLAVERNGVITVGSRHVRGQTPAWSRSDRLAYVRDRAIWVDGKQVTKPRFVWQKDALPAWASNGKLIVFAAMRTNALRGELWQVRPDGSGLQRLTKPTNEYDDGMPSFLPDGRIVFVSTRDKNRELYLFDHGRTRRLTRTPHIDESLPKVSPDGKSVAFEDGRRVGIYTLATGRERFVALGHAPTWVTP